MSTKTTPAADTLKQITHLAAALKAPRITQAAARLAEHARDAGWTHEDYLAAILEREVAARNASGAQLRIRAAGLPAVKGKTHVEGHVTTKSCVIILFYKLHFTRPFCVGNLNKIFGKFYLKISPFCITGKCG